MMDVALMGNQAYAHSLVGRRLVLNPPGRLAGTIWWHVLRYSLATNCLTVRSEGGVKDYLGWKEVKAALDASLLQVVGEVT